MSKPQKSPMTSACPRPVPQDAADEDLPRAGGGSRRGQTGLGGGPMAIPEGSVPIGGFSHRLWLNLTMVYGRYNYVFLFFWGVIKSQKSQKYGFNGG